VNREYQMLAHSITVVKRAGLDKAKVDFKTFRRMQATRTLRAGFNVLPTLQHWMGHECVETIGPPASHRGIGSGGVGAT
jgi:hypothetical protein